MFDKIIRFSIYNKFIVGIFILSLIAWGSYSLKHLPIDAVPDITNNQVQVITVAPTLAAQEVEQYVTAPIEFACLNLPDMIEFRSISRLGLSVITIVLKDNVDIYKARQMINERLKEAEENIPKGVGSPGLAPVSTGLGEIYQYVIHNKPGFDGAYSPMELRTMQDWIVRKQLLSVPGVAEINTLGGDLKQYEVAVNSDKLKSMNVTIPEVFAALENNNENTGGSYIEKTSSSYFIRGIGMVKSLVDIGEIIVKNSNGIPILIRDIGIVQYGSAIRYGAATRNAKGEVVVGVVMMLKGQNSSEVIKAVKEKVEVIQNTLPDGVIIEPFLDRSNLINRTINTITTNLIEGALIVIFILVLLLGNFRAGMVVASVIPLAMLFAICMMKLFGVSGNLMSLGAIDFGLIVDGAVIIVESIVHRIGLSQTSSGRLSQDQMNDEVYKASSRIRTSAAFGELIILIVYLPILTLTGIEGKMFIPMAQTVGFAILGAFILSLTYVPMMSALVLNKNVTHKRNISDRIIDACQWVYNPIIRFALKGKIIVVIVAFTLFIGSLFIFKQLGGEFIPTLEEGDLAINTRIMAGSSLSQNIIMLTKMEDMLKKNFPEVKEVVSRIGSSEIPTDPMSVEVADIIVVLKDKSEWKTAKTREELADMIKSELSTLPGVSMEISQPVQLRFNELMTGVRSDVAIKIYGDDLNLLAEKSKQAIKLIENIEGVADLRGEQVTGLPQISVNYNRSRMAQFGIDILSVNRVLRTAFAGEVAGVVFEGDKRFDMVVRLQQGLRKDITNINALLVPLPNGGQIPLEQLATIKYEEGPMQISRDDGNRRVTLGLNVRNRDVLSVVNDIQKKLDTQLSLPAGYYISYGGQFKNLIEANKRLSITVPVALLLILVLLFFTFNSIKQSLLILTAVPLSAIGGIFALWIRDLPFSISAGVGFIALFGVAVLNGIVLIAEFNRLEEEGVTDAYERVIRGTKIRLRPVIITAAVASLGFIPMALSTGAGAEVQRPLATVVVGGLITATLLTLIVLPALYILFSGNKKTKIMTNTTVVVFILVTLGFMTPNKGFAQNNTILKMDDALKIAMANNPQIKSAFLEVQQQKVIKKSAVDLPKTNVSLLSGQYNSSVFDNNITVSQDFAFPSVYAQQSKVQKQNIILSEKKIAITQSELIRDVKSAYYQLTYIKQLQKLLIYQDSIYIRYKTNSELRFKTGEGSYLEMISAQSKLQEIQVLEKQTEADYKISLIELKKLLNVEYDISIAFDSLQKLSLVTTTDSAATNSNPFLAYYNQRITLANTQITLEKNRFLPDVSVGYFNQTLDKVKGFQGFQVGMGIPVFFWAQKGKVQSAKIQTQIAQSEYENYQNNLEAAFNQHLQVYQKNLQLISFYENTGLKQAEEILKTTQYSFDQGDIGYLEYTQNLLQAIGIKIQYLSSINQLNQEIININYLTGIN